MTRAIMQPRSPSLRRTASVRYSSPFLETVFAGDKELIAYIQKFFGYVLTGETIEHAPWFLPGAEAVWQRIVETERALRARKTRRPGASRA
jgi:hypothetical protein